MSYDKCKHGWVHAYRACPECVNENHQIVGTSISMSSPWKQELIKSAEECGYLTKIIQKQKEAISIAVKALEFECGNRCAHQNPCNSKEALAKINEVLK